MHIPFRPLRLHVLISMLAAASIAAVIGTHTWLTVRGQSEIGAAALEAQAQALAANIAAASAAPLATRRYSELDEMLTRMARFPDVLRIRVADRHGRVLADIARSGGEGAPLRHFDAGTLELPAERRAGVERGTELLVVWQPIEAGVPIGWVRLDYSQHHLGAIRDRIVRNGLIAALVSVAAGFVLFAALLHRPARAVERAADFAARLDERRGEAFPLEHGAREIERLGEALNCVSRRLHEQEQALGAANRRLQAVLTHAIDGILTLDGDSRVETLNPAAERMFGWREADVRGEPFGRLVPDFLLEDGAGPGLPIRFEASARRRDGSTFPLLVGMSDVRLDDRRLFVAVVRDITEQKALEHMKNDFISAMSHELRTPLTSLHGSLGLLAGGEVPGLRGKAADLVRLAYKASARLVRLINDILDFEQIEAGKARFELREVELLPLVKRAIEAGQHNAHLRRVAVFLDAEVPDIRVRTDPDRLAQVLDLLLANAVKLSPPEDTVWVRITRHDGLARIAVTDHGPGIPEALRRHTFQKFVQINATEMRYKDGAGLGLALARAIVEHLEGTMDLASTPQAGTTFFVHLPEAPGPSAGSSVSGVS